MLKHVIPLKRLFNHRHGSIVIVSAAVLALLSTPTWSMAASTSLSPISHSVISTTLAILIAILTIALISRQLTVRRLRHRLDSQQAEKRNMELDLKRFTAIMNQATEAIIITDVQHRIVYINPAFTTLMGYSRRDVYNQTPRLFRTGHHDDRFYQEMFESLNKQHVWKGTFFNRCKDGTVVELETIITAIFDENGAVSNYISAARDVTHEHQLEQQLNHAQKMEALGTLAGGIAHDFNNILSAIIGYAELGLMDTEDKGPLHDHFKQVMKAARRAADLVSQILTFSRRNANERQPLLLTPIIKEALKLLRGTLPTTVEIKHSFQADMPPILADTAQMHQIIMNLCTNANYAMRETGGTLTVDLRCIKIGASRVPWQSSLIPGDYAQLTVADTGHGMDPQTVERIFEPYFTTKGGHDGTGLGLATVHGIVALYGGAIKVDSQKGVGTTFTILLPVCPDDAIMPGDSVSKSPLQHANHERILVVDDEESITKMIEAALSWLGYRVEAFTSSVKAYESFMEAPERFDAVITDQTMPTLPGAELAKRLLACRPELPIILCSGFTDAVDADKAKAIGIREFLMKPISGRDLAAVLQKHINHHPPRRGNAPPTR